MQKLQDRYFLKNLLSSTIFFAFMVLLAVVLTRAAIGLYNKNSMASLKRIQTEKKLVGLIETKNKLEATVLELGTKEGLEKELRENFNVVKPGEKVIVILDDKNKETKSDVAGEVEKNSFWSRILSIFERD